jgi:hypothetical protein
MVLLQTDVYSKTALLLEPMVLLKTDAHSKTALL